MTHSVVDRFELSIDMVMSWKTGSRDMNVNPFTLLWTWTNYVRPFLSSSFFHVPRSRCSFCFSRYQNCIREERRSCYKMFWITLLNRICLAGMMYHKHISSLPFESNSLRVKSNLSDEIFTSMARVPLTMNMIQDDGVMDIRFSDKHPLCIIVWWMSPNYL